jgi:glucosamine--fructose-6-phosphate aminotransferase (isomerizing)
MTATETEIVSQPETWLKALEQTDEARKELIAPGERMLFIGCGTSAFIAASVAALRERAGGGETDSVHASEVIPTRKYDRIVAITRSGTTSEVLRALSCLGGAESASHAARRVAITATATKGLNHLVDHQVTLPFADEQSVVQTRFPTTILALARAALGMDVSAAITDTREVLRNPSLAAVQDYDHFVFLGTGWTLGLAHEAALKLRESARAWAESYPAMDYRHGPISIASARTLVTVFGAVPANLVMDIERTGATVVVSDADPLAQLVQAQLLAVALAAHRQFDPDHPRALTRSVILTHDDPETRSDHIPLSTNDR